MSLGDFFDERTMVKVVFAEDVTIIENGAGLAEHSLGKTVHQVQISGEKLSGEIVLERNI
jgi:hypothetical protein